MYGAIAYTTHTQRHHTTNENSTSHLCHLIFAWRRKECVGGVVVVGFVVRVWIVLIPVGLVEGEVLFVTVLPFLELELLGFLF